MEEQEEFHDIDDTHSDVPSDFEVIPLPECFDTTKPLNSLEKAEEEGMICLLWDCIISINAKDMIWVFIIKRSLKIIFDNNFIWFCPAVVSPISSTVPCFKGLKVQCTEATTCFLFISI